MNKPTSSFNVDDIHKIREDNYKKTKNIPLDEQIRLINQTGLEYFNKIKAKYLKG